MANKRIVWLFPVLTHSLFSFFLPLFGGFSLENIGYVFLFATLPAFLFAILCVRFQFHQRNLIQIGFWSGLITFSNTLILFSILLALKPIENGIPMWEHTLAVFFYALMFALPAIIYALLVLRWFLEKKVIT